MERLHLDAVLLDARPEHALQLASLLDRDALHVLARHLGAELGVGELLLGFPVAVHQLEDQQRDQNDEGPERRGPQKPVHAAPIHVLRSVGWLLHPFSTYTSSREPAAGGPFYSERLATNGR